MQPVYVESPDNTMKYFICGIEENSKNHDYCNFDAINEISERAFLFSKNLKHAIFTNSLKTIKKEAFKDCEELEAFCCGKLGSDTKTEEKKSTLKGVEIAEFKSDENEDKSQSENNIKQFTIETSAFANCNKLHTVMLPKCENLIIEKNAFSGCEKLRTVVALVNSIKITENPFEDCPKELVFVCSRGSAIEQFARENGYRYINV